VYQFGNNERRRTNVVAAAAVPKLMAMGLFEVFDPERHNEDGTPKADKEIGRQGEGEPVIDPNLADEQTSVSLSPSLPVSLSSSAQPAAEAGQGELTSPAPPSPVSTVPPQPAAAVRAKPSASKK
jgi:hypothetical protein